MFSFLNCTPTRSSTDPSPVEIQGKIDKKQFTFIAESVTPLRGNTSFLTSAYDVYVRLDSVIAYLPYFGRATSAPLNPTEGGIKFTSTRFSYSADKVNSYRWDIIIKPLDVRDVQQLSLTIFDNGKASLLVSGNTRDPITFEGRIK